MSQTNPFLTLTKKTAVIMAFCFVLGGAIPATLVTLVLGDNISNNSQAIDTAEEQAKATNVAVVNALHKTCEQDEKFRIQYKVRGRAEKTLGAVQVKLLGLFLNLARENLATGVGDSALNTDFLQQFGPLAKELKPLLERIKILPPPDCDKQSRQLISTLRNIPAGETPELVVEIPAPSSDAKP